MELKEVGIGKLKIGNGNKIAVQSMLNVSHGDFEGLCAQAAALKEAGADIIRMAVPDTHAVQALYNLRCAVDIPVVADIHYDYKLALESVAAGADKIRINPGNIGAESRVKAVADACAAQKVPIRIGVNSGSIEKSILHKYGHPNAQALAESALYHASLLEKADFDRIVLSVKSSDVRQMIEANRILRRSCAYPLHLGVTEAGTERMGTIKSAIGIGALLADGIGDTIRVSLTADPVKEIAAAFDILKAAGIQRGGVEIISCPTCGRTKIDIIALAQQAEQRFAHVKQPLRLAIMGCAVNGPGEAREADIGIAGGMDEAVLFAKGRVLRKVPESEIMDALETEIKKLLKDL